MSGAGGAALIATGMMTVATVVVVWLVLRHRHQVRQLLSHERMAALEKGVEIPWELDAARPRRAWRLQLKAGFLLGGAGLGFIVASAVSRTGGGMLPFGVFLLVTGLSMIAYDALFGRHEYQRSAALDEELTRAYIRRLEGSATRAHDAAENAGALR